MSPEKPFEELEQASPPQDQIDTLIKLYHSGQMAMTTQACTKLLQAHPQSLVVLNILGASLQGQGMPAEAVASYNKAIELKPDYAEAYYNRGNALHALGRLEEVVASYTKAIEYKPDFVDAYNNRGNALAALGQLEEAVESYDMVIQLAPGFAEAYYNRGNALRDLERAEDAVESYNSAIQLEPDYALAYNNRGVAFQKLGHLTAAVESYDKAIQIMPDTSDFHYNRGKVLLDLGQPEQAVENYDRTIQLKPDFAHAHSGRVFALNYSSELTQAEIYVKHLEFGQQFGQATAASLQSDFPDRNKNKRIRVGYLSPDFRQHSVAYFCEPVLKAHDRGTTEVYCYYNNRLKDGITNRIMHEVEHWRFVDDLDDQNLFELIRKDNIDILVDLAGHTARNRLLVLAQKPAPIQVTWLGYPNTTGLSAIDYRFTDVVADPVGEADGLHSEELIRLADGFLCYLGDDSIPENKSLPCLERGHITFGSFNHLAKTTHHVVKLWARILLALPDAHLLLKSRQLADRNTQTVFLNMFVQEGIALDRIELHSHLPKQEDHLALYNRVDIALDPFPYNGTTTTCEALWMGVPVITLSGDRHVARVGASVLTHAGFPEFIANNPEEYVNMAVRYANNTDYLAELRSGLRDNMKHSPLCDAEVFTKR